MRTAFRLPTGALLALGLAACSGARASKLASARTDTLPGGVIQVQNDAPTAWTDSTTELVEEGRFQGEDGTPAELGEPRSIAVDEQGRIYVVDNKPAAIKVFSPDGKLVRTIGREGEGPGEFRVGFIAIRGAHLVLHDPMVARTSVFDTSGTFLRGWHSSCCYWSDIEVDSRDRIYVPSMSGRKPGEPSRGIPYVRWSLEGTALDTLWVPQRDPGKVWTVEIKKGGKQVGMMSTGVPFQPSMASTLHPDSGFVFGWTGEYRVVRSLTGKDSVRLFGRSWTADPISDARRKGEVESRIKQSAEFYGEDNVRAAFRLDDVPTTLPAFLNLRVDPAGRVWVRRHPVADTTHTSYDVFDSSGAYLGPVAVPFKIHEWGNQAWTRNGLVTVIEDTEGRPTIVRLRFTSKSP